MAFKNAARFRAKVSRLPAAFQTAVRDAMAKTADEIVEAMRNVVRVEHGDLKESIGWCWGSPPKGAHVLTTLTAAPASKDSKFRLTIFAGNYKAFYARWVEFGTHAHAPGRYRDAGGRKRNAGTRGHAATPAHPFFYPIWRAYKKLLRRRIVAALNKVIKSMAAANG